MLIQEIKGRPPAIVSSVIGDVWLRDSAYKLLEATADRARAGKRAFCLRRQPTAHERAKGLPTHEFR
jgi:hypothetical protein